MQSLKHKCISLLAFWCNMVFVNVDYMLDIFGAFTLRNFYCTVLMLLCHLWEYHHLFKIDIEELDKY